MAAPVYIFAGGGTGGHLFPGLATAAALQRRAPDAQIIFLTTTRPIDRDLIEPTGFSQITQSVRPWPAKLRDVPGFYLAWRASLRSAAQVMRAHQPRAVLGLGGYAAGPPVVAASRAGVRTAILNPDAVPGRANRRLVGYADRVILQWDASRAHFGNSAKCAALGCPIRSEFATAADRAEDPVAIGEARRQFDLDPEKQTVLVTGASQGARTVNDAILWAWERFRAEAADWQVLHLTGSADHDRIAAAWKAIGGGARTIAFSHEMPAAMLAADVVVSRAGASTLAELTAVRRPSILMPYPYHKDQHQMRNAEALAERGAARIVADTRAVAENGPNLLAALRALKDPAARASMRQACGALSRPDASETVAAWMLGG